MANTITGLFPDIYAALDLVSREQVGFVPAVQMDSLVERAAEGQTVRSHISTAESATDITPGVTPPDDGDNVASYVDIVIDNAKRVPIRWNGTEAKKLSFGVGTSSYATQRFAQAFRTLTNLVEASLAANYVVASRAYGTAGTTPFGSNLGETAQMLKIFKDNGAGSTDLRMVIDTTAGANLRTLAQLTKANEAGTDATLRTGAILDINGFRIGESNAVASHTKGTGTGYLVNNVAGYSVGDTSIAIDTGSGTVVAGDVVTFAGDTNKYLVTSGVTAPGTITIAAPGLRQSLADGVAMTIGNSYTANMAFSRPAFILAARAPDLPEEGDMAEDRQIVTDPFSGLNFEIALYKQYRQIQYEVSLAWGSKVVKPEFTAILLG